jgi:hypothetical protein
VSRHLDREYEIYIEPTPKLIDDFNEFYERIQLPENEYWLEEFEHRAGFLQYCGGAINEQQAEFRVWKEVAKQMRFQKQQPKPRQ